MSDWTPDLVEQRMLAAGRTLLRLRVSGHTTGWRTFWPDIVHDYWETYGQDVPRLRPAHPDARSITEMDEAYAWLSRHIPDDRIGWRRAVALKSLNDPITCEPVMSNRRIAVHLNTSHHTVKTWYSYGLGRISAALAQKSTSQTSQVRALKTA